MAPSKQIALVAVLFLVPVIFCFVGIGAFVHMALAEEARAQQEQLELRRQQRREAAARQERLDTLQRTAAELERKIAEIQNRIAELAEKLVGVSEDEEAARAIEAEIDGLKEEMAGLLAELSELRDETTKTRQRVDELNTETEDAGALDERLKELEARLSRIRERVERASAQHDRLAARADELRREQEERDRERAIVPSQPLPPGMPKPVFVECTASGVIIQPAGTTLGLDANDEDRARFLAAARKSGFVVFLVRPGGFESFRAYRAIVENEEAMRFGYEPVDASWDLVYPK